MSTMDIDEAVKRACKEPTLHEALVSIAIWENERAIKEALKYYETGEITASHGGGWDTCFRVCFDMVLKRYAKKTDKYYYVSTALQAGYRLPIYEDYICVNIAPIYVPSVLFKIEQMEFNSFPFINSMPIKRVVVFFKTISQEEYYECSKNFNVIMLDKSNYVGYKIKKKEV